MNKENKSISLNMIINTIRGVLNVAFPLVTFKYISSVLGVEGTGKYSFANSFIGYFVLIAGFGISSYAIRTGAALRDDKKEISKFSSQLFSISLICTLLSYAVLWALLTFVPELSSYRIVIIILSAQILLKTIGIEWIYQIFEDYKYITLRSLLFQAISLVLMFIFVKDERDLNKYCAIVVLATSGQSIMNYIHARRYRKISIVQELCLAKHLRPLLYFFATNIAVTIYVISDITMLGFICDDYTIGIYSVSSNIYKALKTVLSSAIVVSIPRMSYYWNSREKDKFSTLGYDVYMKFITFALPVIVGTIVLSSELIWLTSSNDYSTARDSLLILALALYFCLGAGFWSQGVLLPLNKEKKVFTITVVSAVVNILLNFVMIPLLKEKGAAITTLISEAMVFFYCRRIGRDYVCMDGLMKFYIKILLGCIPIPIIFCILNVLQIVPMVKIIMLVMVSICSYYIIELVLKNAVVLDLSEKIRIRIR